MLCKSSAIELFSMDNWLIPGFLGNIIENMKQEFSKNKELQESLKKFREDAKKLEESQELKDARRKFESIEGGKDSWNTNSTNLMINRYFHLSSILRGLVIWAINLYSHNWSYQFVTNHFCQQDMPLGSGFTQDCYTLGLGSRYRAAR